MYEVNDEEQKVVYDARAEDVVGPTVDAMEQERIAAGNEYVVTIYVTQLASLTALFKKDACLTKLV